MLLLLASSNPHKAAEFRRLFANTKFEPRTPPELGVDALNVPENGVTFAANARSKAEAYVQAYRIASLADDSGIHVDALGGAPGVRSARFGRPGFDDADRLNYLLTCMTGIPNGRRGAHYVCELVLAMPGVQHISATGMWYGVVALGPGSGNTGFGYDPAFMVPSLGKTVSELSAAEKDAFSHRGKAVRSLIAAISAAL